MAQRVFALLVGIDNYSEDVGPLAGCVNDTREVQHYLQHSGDGRALAIEVLTDGDATRANLVRMFRQHLGQARKGDVALFHYSGHGARWQSAAAFREFYPDGKDEGLVLIDSRRAGGYDLADKELAVLIAEVARRGVHTIVSLDCCHSGSGTRGADAFRGLRPRVTHEVFDERPLETYLDGHYMRWAQQRQPLFIPRGRHILLAACERTQLALETPDHHGVFTATMLEVLEKSGGRLPYAELFMRCRAAVRTRADGQLPQFETYDHFNAWAGFLGRPVTAHARRFQVAFEKNEWRINCGAIQGMSTDLGHNASVQLYPEDDPAHPAGHAITRYVGAQHSALKLDFNADPSARFQARICSLPVAPLWLWTDPGSAQHAALAAALAADASPGVALSDVRDAARYDITRDGARMVLTECGTQQVIQGFAFDPTQPQASMPQVLEVLTRVAQWERGLELANPSSRLNPSIIDFVCTEPVPAGEPIDHAGPEVTLEGMTAEVIDGARWWMVRPRLRARNQTGALLHFLLLYYSPAYGVHVLRNEPVPSGPDWVVLYGEGPDDCLRVGDDEYETHDRFRLLVSAERVDDFLLSQDDLELGATRPGGLTKAIGGAMRRGRVEGDWLAKRLNVRTVRRLTKLGRSDWVSPCGVIRVQGHPSFKAEVSLGTPPPVARQAGEGLPFQQAFARAGLELVRFARTSAAAASVLELSGIQNAAELATQPLQLELAVPLEANEGILPFAWDGQHLLLAGQPARDAERKTHITIDRLYEVPLDRRSLGGALKLNFFKTELRGQHTNRLCWVEYCTDGSVIQHDDGVAAQVARATRVLLLVHGIVADTKDMAAGIGASGLNQHFDLVLSYDYENLDTPIGETARWLQADLTTVGLRPDAGRHLTVLAHSMGGLVSRWLIEGENGPALVDHLVMCGTPNEGLSFGKVAAARQVVTMLTGLSANVAPAVIPFSATLLFRLNESKRLPLTLEQMSPSSDFIRTLNAKPEPHIRYTVLGGNVHDYHEPGDPFFASLLIKLGQRAATNLLFNDRPNDIAVAVDSSFGHAPESARLERWPVACHHLNYFSSRNGQAALRAVRW